MTLQAVEKAMRLLDHSLADDRPVLEHVLQVDQVAVVFLLCKIVRVVEMDDPLLHEL